MQKSQIHLYLYFTSQFKYSSECTTFELKLKGDKSFSISNWGQECSWCLSLILIVACRSHIDDDDFNPKNSKNVSKRIEKKNFSHLSKKEG